MLFDSNVVIRAAEPGRQRLRRWLSVRTPVVSSITYVEVFGFHGITAAADQALRALFSNVGVLPVTDDVIEQAVALRRQRRMSLGDSLIAATAIVEGAELVTRNISDFRWISGLTVIDPAGDLGADA